MGGFAHDLWGRELRQNWVQKIFEGTFNNSVKVNLTRNPFNSFSKIVSVDKSSFDILCFDEIGQMILSLAEIIEIHFCLKLSFL